MSTQVIPLTNTPNQSFETTLDINGQNVTLDITLRYNRVAEYWSMTITDSMTGDLILDSIPFVTGESPAANILQQYAYLNIGKAYIVPVSPSDTDFPDDSDGSLGTAYILMWTDN